MYIKETLQNGVDQTPSRNRSFK